MAKVIQVIETTEKRGKGVEGDPIRGAVQYWSLDGELLAENDPVHGRDHLSGLVGTFTAGGAK